MNSFVDHIKKHLEVSLTALLQEIDVCPDELWSQEKGGFVFWQQVLHAMAGLEFWTRSKNTAFVEPFAERKVYPELDHAPEGYVSKDEMRLYGQKVSAQIAALFRGKTDEWLMQASAVYAGSLNLEVLQGQLRHVMYHVGHCDSILRENGFAAVEWVDYLGEDLEAR